METFRTGCGFNVLFQVANIADLYYKTLNTRVSVVYIETWQGGDQIVINRSQGIDVALTSFNDYTKRTLYKVDKDTTQLLTGEIFVGGEAGKIFINKSGKMFQDITLPRYRSTGSCLHSSSCGNQCGHQHLRAPFACWHHGAHDRSQHRNGT